MRRGRAARLLLAAAFAAPGAQAQERGIPLDQLKSGSAFLGQDLRALQADEFANPGMLWVERGEKLWREPAGKKSLACASCHKEVNMRWVAARYPRIDSRRENSSISRAGSICAARSAWVRSPCATNPMSCSL